MTGQLKQLRDKIDSIDSELLKLVSARADLAREIGQVKNGVAYRPEREAQVLARLCELNPGPLPNEHIVRLFTEILTRPRVFCSSVATKSRLRARIKHHWSCRPETVLAQYTNCWGRSRNMA